MSLIIPAPLQPPRALGLGQLRGKRTPSQQQMGPGSLAGDFEDAPPASIEAQGAHAAPEGGARQAQGLGGRVAAAAGGEQGLADAFGFV